MIDLTVLKTKISVSPLFFAVLTAVLILDKTGVSGSAVLFSLLHESGHFMALLCAKTYPKNIEINAFGIHISLLENLSTAKKCFVFMAGFAVNFLLAVLFFTLEKPLLGYINLIIGVFTALPLSSTDGGSVLGILLEEFFPQKAKSLFRIISGAIFAAVSAVLIFAAVFTKNYFIIIAVFYMTLCAIKTAAG